MQNFSKYSKNIEFRIRKYLDTLYLFDGTQFFELNNAAKEIWLNIGKNKSIGELSDEFKIKFDLNEYDFCDDIIECLDFFTLNGIIYEN